MTPPEHGGTPHGPPISRIAAAISERRLSACEPIMQFNLALASGAGAAIKKSTVLGRRERLTIEGQGADRIGGRTNKFGNLADGGSS